MPISNVHAQELLRTIQARAADDPEFTRCRPRSPDEEPLPQRLTGTTDYSAAGVAARRRLLEEFGVHTDCLNGIEAEPTPEQLSGNVENLIGFARIPVGAIGPLRVNGLHAHGDFFVPLATTEGALVASYHRGAYLASQCGGVTAACLTESVARAPCFVFHDMLAAGRFLTWAVGQFDRLQEAVAATSRYCCLQDVKPCLLGKELYLVLEFHPGDAAGQNMVTIASEAIVHKLLEGAPVAPEHWFLDGNLSGDKKATAAAFLTARGKKVVAEAVIDKKLVRKFLHTDVERMIRYWQISVLGGVQSGSIGVQGHYANALAALFIACGQDAACVSEAAIGVTRMDTTSEGDLYVSVSLPNLIVGTVGGGTRLPTARECLQMLDCVGTGKAPKFAEICAATVLAGEISIIGAMSAGDFGQAHAHYGRQNKPSEEQTP